MGSRTKACQTENEKQDAYASLRSKTSGNLAEVALEIAKFNRRKRYVINPQENRIVRVWDSLACVALIFVCFVSPYEVAFIVDEKTLAFVESGADTLFWINRTVDLLFTIDMVLQFFMMYPVRHAHGTTLVVDHRQIIRHHLRTWFVIDLLSVLPFDLIALFIQSKDLERLRLMKAIRLLRLLKLARLFRGLRIIRRWEVKVKLSYMKSILWGMVLAVVVISHWIGCMLGLLSNMQGDLCREIPQPHCVETWFGRVANPMLAVSADPNSFSYFLSSLTNAASIIVHPHAFTNVNEIESTCFVLLIFIGGVIWTMVISRSTSIATSLDRHGIAFRQTMDDLNGIMTRFCLVDDLKNRLRTFFMNLRDQSQQNTWKNLTSELPPSLQAEVAVALNKAWLRRVPYLVGQSKLFTGRVSVCIKSRHYAQQERFGSNFTLYILNRGLCSRSLRHGHLRILAVGDVWGQEHLLLTSWWLLLPNTVCALTFVDVMTLDRESFQAVVRDHPETEKHIRRHQIWCALIRGVIYKGQQMKLQEGLDMD